MRAFLFLTHLSTSVFNFLLDFDDNDDDDCESSEKKGNKKMEVHKEFSGDICGDVCVLFIGSCMFDKRHDLFMMSRETLIFLNIQNNKMKEFKSKKMCQNNSVNPLQIDSTFFN
jgi:hypothetical protein